MVHCRRRNLAVPIVLLYDINGLGLAFLQHGLHAVQSLPRLQLRTKVGHDRGVLPRCSYQWRSRRHRCRRLHSMQRHGPRHGQHVPVATRRLKRRMIGGWRRRMSRRVGKWRPVDERPVAVAPRGQRVVRLSMTRIASVHNALTRVRLRTSGLVQQRGVAVHGAQQRGGVGGLGHGGGLLLP